ncbi:MucBP domain-containing protein [Streptococcus suis]|uniref:MucBP domain-containing protein n=3 Tax=Streptococcus suis TaxID=1307 RepID=UPI00114722FE|nr:MucBP domain-containing protein [Streptococcus suis]NQI76255.1 YSIRK-type signal peptide-containing protein [Streptococcus suis]NQI78328.1 YSIRK-type signal peptide-containing protein [Streptococcus suis]NQI82119.1 YSIRK-type signal peptide-containing protein [Streptococcus suis]TQE82295.1 YSIRK-type signal peptide-containing protein [Streptococcus suis]HEL2321107.1 MucBP domain-containing protein [Streptococcus suis]
MRKAKKKSFNWYGMKQHFSIRKYHFGAASVLLGMSLVMGAGAQTVKAEETAASSDATTATVASSTDSSASSETVVAEATVASTTETVASTERTATINYIVQYVLEDGTVVKADVKTTSVTTTEAIATSTVEVATELPTGYELVTGQSATVSQEVTENGENIVTVKVVKKAEEKATTSETTSSATTTAIEETTTVTETVKTPATVEEAKVVLEQVTSEAEVLANESERLVAASDKENTTLKAAATATKLTATEATAVLNDSAATLESVNAQIDAVRTSVEALALELRKYLGTDVIEIALNTSVSNLNVTEGEGILVGTTSTATPTMDDPHGASVGRHSLPTGVATTEDGWFTFAVYDLRSYNTNQSGSVVKGTAVPAYIRYSLDKDPTTATVLAELVSTEDGRVLEKVTIEPGAEVALSYPTTVNSNNEPVKLVYDTSEAVEGGVSGTIQFSAQDKNSGNFGSYSTTYVPPYVVNTTRYVTENGDLIATYNVQTISGQPVTSSGQREFTGVEYVSQSIEVADSIYPKGSKSVATTYDLGNAVKVKVIRDVVDYGKMTLTFYVSDPSYTGTLDLATTDTTGFLPVFETSALTHRVGNTYVYNKNQNFIGNYVTDPNDPTGSRKIYAVSAPNDQGSMYRIVANFSGDNTTDSTAGRLYLSSEVWSTKEKATNGEDIGGFAWRTGIGEDKFVDKGYTPGGRQNILRVGTLASANQITYVYRALEQEAIIRYQVEGATDYLEESAIQTGGSGSDINYSTEDTINKYKKLGYTLVSDDFTTDAGQDYDYDTAVRQEFLVVIKPRIEEVPNTAVPGQPVDPTDPNSPVWPDSINNLETTQEVTRTTEYKYEDGTPVRVDATGNILPKDSTEGTPLVKTETVTFTRPAQVNLVTGEVTYGEWAADSTDVLNGNLIPEISDYTATRTTLEGADAQMTESVTDKTVVATDADINEVVFYTPNPKYGDVVVNYVNTDGKVIATPVVDTNDALVGTDYSTADQVPAKIVEDATGDVYYYKEIKAEDAAKETGKVVEGTTEVTYVYEKAGNVVVNYTLADGTVIKDPVNDETNAEPGSTYTTTDNKPETITTADGKVYKLVPTATVGNEDGQVEAGKTIEVTYIYEEVKSDVVVEYYDTEGNVIAKTVTDTDDASVGTVYNTDEDNRPETITTADGTVYYYKEVKDSSAPTTGKVAETTTTVQYVYEKAGNVVVNYIAEDGTVIKAPVNDETNAKPGTEYSTTDNKPTTITTEDGKTYELIPTATIGTEEGTVEAGKTTEVTYVYKEVKGSVVVNYVTTDGTVLQAPVTDTPETSTGTAYDTTDNKPTTITTADGKTYRLVPKLTVGNEDGTVVAGVTEITYVYEEVKGDVVVNYVNTDGKVIATPVVDTKATSTGTAYDTTDNKPEKIIEDATGDVYYYKEVQAGSNETGKVVEGTTEVTYVYEKAGNVVVNYITEDGTVIKTPVNDETNAKPGSPYDTTDNKPKTITTEDGTTYELVRTDGNENGSVEGGKTTEVTYVYRKVEAPVAKTGNVVVEYYNTDGEKIAADVEDTPEAAVGTVYETLDYKPTTITKDGVKYYYKEVKATSATEKGTVTEGTTTVQYVYEPGGSVTVNYVTTDGTVIKSPVKDEENAEPGKSYTTEDNKPTTITTEDGKTYKLVPNATTGDENGTITSGEDKQVTYVYEEVKGNVVVNYIDTEGNVIKTPVEDTKSASTGTAYDTTDNKPTTITTEDGTEYRLVPVLTKGEETGKVVEGTTQVTYVYQKVTTPAPKPNGSVVVNYVNTNGETIATSVNDTTDAKLDTPYDTTDYKPAIIKHDGVTYYYKEVKSGDSETGNVVEGTTEVTYIYEPGGSVTVNYVTTDGTVIKSPVKDEENAEPGKSYTTEDNKPTTITTEDGKTYKLVPNATTGDENGTITSGEDKQVTYVYEEVKGNVVVNYIDTEGNVIKTPVEDTKSASTGTAYDTTDNKPTTITTEDGTVYEIVPVLTIGSESGSVVEGTTQVTYVYRKVSTPTPAVKNGTVVVNYVTEDGTVIKSPVTDTPTSPEGTSYDTTDNKPTEIVTEDGSRYVLIPSKTIGSENGTVVEGETVVTYVYKKVANWIPQIPSTPENPTPVNPVVPYPFDPTNPDKPVDPTTPGTNGEVPNIPYVPGYTPVDPKGNTPLKPVDPNDPSKGYVPPTPDETGKDTPIPYVQNGNVVVNYVTEDGTVIKAPVQDETNVPAGKSYDTTDNKPKTITTEDGTTYELVRVDGSENGKVEGGKTTEVTYVYRKVTPAKKVVTNHVDEEGNPIAPQEEGTTPDKSIPGYEFTGKTITDEDGNTTHIYKKTPTKKVVTNHVDEEGNVISPQEEGTTPNKGTSIPGYEYVRTVVDVEGNTTHIYRKVSNKPTPPATETPVKPQPATPTPTADKAKQLPNTGEASSSAGVLGAAMLVAAIALAGKRRRNED